MSADLWKEPPLYRCCSPSHTNTIWLPLARRRRPHTCTPHGNTHKIWDEFSLEFVRFVCLFKPVCQLYKVCTHTYPIFSVSIQCFFLRFSLFFLFVKGCRIHLALMNTTQTVERISDQLALIFQLLKNVYSVKVQQNPKLFKTTAQNYWSYGWKIWETSVVWNLLNDKIKYNNTFFSKYLKMTIGTLSI